MIETPQLLYRSPTSDLIESRLTVVLRTALCITMIVLVLQINSRISSGHSGDFRHFYFAAGAMLDHRDMYGAMPLDVVERALGRPARQVEINWYTIDADRYLYPPLIAMLYTPIARIRFDTAQRIMLIINAVLAYAGILLTARVFTDRFGFRQSHLLIAAAALMGALLNLDKIHADLQMFQTNSLMFFMFALSLYWLDRKPMLAGVPLGFIFNIKYLSLGILPWLIVRRRWGTAAAYLVSTIALAFLPAVISGWRLNLHNLSVAYGGLFQMVGVHGSTEQANVDDIRNYLSCSITSAMARTTHRGDSLLRPMIYTAGIVSASVLIVICIYVVKRVPVFAWPARRLLTEQPWKAMTGVEFVCIIAATLCFSPQTNTRHLMMVLLLTIPMSGLVLGAVRGVSRAWVIAGVLLIAVGFIYPIGGQAAESHKREMYWFGIGGQCWCLLIGMFSLIWTGASQAMSQTQRANSPADLPTNN